MIVSRPLALYAAAIAVLVALQPMRVSAQWWNRAPADFEECSEAAEKASVQVVIEAINCFFDGLPDTDQALVAGLSERLMREG